MQSLLQDGGPLPVSLGVGADDAGLEQAEHPEIFVAPAKEKDAQKRALLVLKWFLSTLKQQYSSRNEKL